MAITSTAPVAAAKWERTAIITSTQSWAAPADVTSVDLVLVGGGGGASGHNTSQSFGGGGGGGGAQVLKRTIAVTPNTSYTVTIGAGGAAGAIGAGNTQDRNGYAGESTSFSSLAIALGGGAGIFDNNIARTGVGYNGGGRGVTSGATYVAGGGGGAGAAPGGVTNELLRSTASSPGSTIPFYGTTKGGNPGANGVSSFSVTWVQFAQAWGGKGIDGFGGGGGGGACNSTSFTNPNVAPTGIWGSDGGGYGSIGNGASSGTANTGGGGGGGGNQEVTAGAGGSGICIIKYWSAL